MPAIGFFPFTCYFDPACGLRHEESPAIVKIITDAVKPVSLHRAVTEQMTLKRNKPLKKDVYRFVRWLREYAIGHKRFVGSEEDTKPAAKPDPPKTNQGGTHGLRTAPTQSTPQAPVTATAPQTPPGLTSTNGCLKCKSTNHRVRECSSITEEESVKLFKAHGRALGLRFGSLEFKTGCGPLMLRGLCVCVDEAVAGVELALGLPVMQKLGYSVKTLLENSRRQEAEWYFAHQSMRRPVRRCIEPSVWKRHW
ncbi:hypothetical protein DYB28_002237 [Aphanomyces astaci]|uniref:Uncharacterized protein n=1 Tax=Aphanomyces astaci TaxID=112090 RepID=A0A9X8E2I3_APHAT|nr:hypothetical protein DYB28_002237 [Aphanomyces astaci]